ncbi:CDP-diacylglycerol--serine O-phosphatidyltransferase [Liberibacter sp. Z1]|nr:CDP-diacylglycerol--serine O-phosphatidyltransferase [Candidatus Liberibacter sp.]MBA5724014.1 CDP-diacylglycerol--serine O-phosphatidyltransferase [Candidatus Liberibacter sp.]
MKNENPEDPTTFPPNRRFEGKPQAREVRPFRFIFPNVITILAICAGFSGIRLSLEGQFEKAVYMVLVAAFLDGIDGRIARLMKATSKFGGQMDSLADIVNFGVAPSLVAYIAVLQKAHTFGWSAALVYTVATSLRLARFNVMNECDQKETWQNEYFMGIPAPFGAILLLLPVYISFLGFPIGTMYSYSSAVYSMIIGFLLCSRLPVWSGKRINIHKNLLRDFALPAILGSVTYITFMIHFFWEFLIISVLLYVIFLPISYYFWHRRYGKLEIEMASHSEKKTDFL